MREKRWIQLTLGVAVLALGAPDLAVGAETRPVTDGQGCWFDVTTTSVVELGYHEAIGERDAAGNLIVTVYSPTWEAELYRVTPEGQTTLILDASGDGVNPFSGQEFAADTLGNVYAVGRDTRNVFKIADDGSVTQIIDETGDGIHQLFEPQGIAIDGAGNVFVGTDGYYGENKVFKIVPDGTVSLVLDDAGDGVHPLDLLNGIALDDAGNLYAIGWNSNNLFKVTPVGGITQLMDISGDGVSVWVIGPDPNGVGFAVDGPGNVYVAGPASNNAFKIDPAGVVTEILNAAGDGTRPLGRAGGVGLDHLGNVYVDDGLDGFSDPATYKITAEGEVSLLFDTTTVPILSAVGADSLDVSGNRYIAGFDSCNLFRISPNGTVVEMSDWNGDGDHQMCQPVRIFVEPDGTLLVSTVYGTKEGILRIEATPDDSVDGVDDDCDGVVDEDAQCELQLGVSFPPASDPQSWVDGLEVQLNGGVGSEPGCPEVMQIEWDWGDGIVENLGFPAFHEYSAPGVYSVTVTAYDTEGGSKAVTGSVETFCSPLIGVDFPPASDPQSWVDGLHVQLNGGVGSSPGCPEISQIEWDWGDGQVENLGFPAFHEYSAPGVYSVTVTVSDAEGGSRAVTGTVELVCSLNIGVDFPPASDPQSWVDGLQVQLNGGVGSSPGCPEISQIEWDWGDGQIENLGFPAVHEYSAPGVYSVTVTVSDAEGGSRAVTGTVELVCSPNIGVNFPPHSDPQSWIDGVDVQVNGGVGSSPGCPEITQIEWDWGDGVVFDQGFPAVHTYQLPGLYSVTVTTYDGAGNSSALTGTIEIIVPESWETEPGVDVVVTPVDQETGESSISLDFDEVTAPGVSSASATEETPEPPETNFQLAGEVYFEITTTAAFTGSVEVCIDYSGFSVDEAGLAVMHLGVDSVWEDITNPDLPPEYPNPDTVNKTICGTTTSLSLFALFQRVRIEAPMDPLALGETAEASVPLADPESVDAAEWRWGDGTTSPAVLDATSVKGDHVYGGPGVYIVGLTLWKNTKEVGSAEFQYIVIYDPDAGFVTGGGWIDSPSGAYVSEPTLTGKANFGFVSKYRRGATVPTGNTQFKFKAAGLDFHSTHYQWLVVAGARAKFKGEGTINGDGEFGFMITAVDGALPGGGSDRFRIKIWDKIGDIIVYDNNIGADDSADPATELGGGSIVIHRN